VVGVSEIPPPQEMLFRAGLAYPIRAEIAGRGPGAVRTACFPLGRSWNHYRVGRTSAAPFQRHRNPAPMNEMTPYGHIEPRHLHGYFESHQGQFIDSASGGRTRVEGKPGIPTPCGPKRIGMVVGLRHHRIHMRV